MFGLTSQQAQEILDAREHLERVQDLSSGPVADELVRECSEELDQLVFAALRRVVIGEALERVRGTVSARTKVPR